MYTPQRCRNWEGCYVPGRLCNPRQGCRLQPCWQGRETAKGVSVGPAKLSAAGQAPSWTPSWDLLLPVQVEKSLLFQLSSGRKENLRALFTDNIDGQSDWSTWEERGKHCTQMCSHHLTWNIYYARCCKPRVKGPSTPPLWKRKYSTSLLNTQQSHLELVTQPGHTVQQHSPSLWKRNQAKPYGTCQVQHITSAFSQNSETFKSPECITL